MKLQRSGSQPSLKGSAETFTGNVRVDPLFQPPGPGSVSGAYVTFEPGAGLPGTRIRWVRRSS